MLENYFKQKENNLNTTEKLHSNINKLYLYWFFHSLIFAYVIERLFGLERGITIQQMIYIEIIYAAVVMVLEIPTGVLADRWSRKKIMIISTIFNFFEIFILIFAHDFWAFALSSVSAAFGGALASGTSNALFYDSLKLTGSEKEFEKVIGKNNFYYSISGILAPLIGALIAAHYGYTMTYWFSLIGIIISLFIVFTIEDPELIPNGAMISEAAENQSMEVEEEKFDFRKAVQFLKENNSIRFIMLYAVILGAVITYVDEYWQVYLQDIGIPVAAFGTYSVFYSIIMSITGIFAYKLRKLFGYKLIFSVCVLFSGLTIVFSSLTYSPYGFIILPFTYLFYGVTEPLVMGYIHHRTASIHRATIESFFSLALRMVTIIVGLLFGYISNQYSIFSGFGFLGLVILGYSLSYLISQFKYINGEK